MAVICFSKTLPFLRKKITQEQKSPHSAKLWGLIHLFRHKHNMNVMPIMEFTLLGLSFEVLLCIALKQRKIANLSIFPNYFLSAIAACMADHPGRHFSFYAKRTPRQGSPLSRWYLRQLCFVCRLQCTSLHLYSLCYTWCWRYSCWDWPLPRCW